MITQLTKSWEVAIGLPVIVQYPTDAVLDRHTVFVGSIRADEFSTPRSVMHSSVSVITFPWDFLASLMLIQGILPFQYSGFALLGV